MASPDTITTLKTPKDFPIPSAWQDLNLAKRVTLGGQEWAIAPMTGRNIAKFTAHAIGMKGVLSNMLGQETDPETGKITSLPGEEIEKNIEKLYRGVHFGLMRAYPDLDFETFFDMAIRPSELQDAYMVVAESAGVEFKKVSTTGEAQAAPGDNPSQSKSS